MFGLRHIGPKICPDDPLPRSMEGDSFTRMYEKSHKKTFAVAERMGCSGQWIGGVLFHRTCLLGRARVLENAAPCGFCRFFSRVCKLFEKAEKNLPR